tara:strand:+ start:1012 stop:1194 length:183 start_codon:yes stop_codon:yes gene_type:complete
MDKITNAKWCDADERTGEITTLTATINGVDLVIPKDSANRHYAEILKQVEAKTLTIADAD